jgi:23S rRNA (cytidine1920-2'-O)/16S rRNA (cytidine1409-2'-O)-methyltransferase
VRRKLVESRSEAQRAIDAGLVRVGSHARPKAATLVAPSDPIHLVAPPARFVSRAGRKLDGALDTFGIDVTDAIAIDLGASTGGFTDCLLQRGARRVVAVDVGYGQMHWRIRTDERVEVIERTNIRTADPEVFGGPFDIVTADLSFISLRTLVTQIEPLGAQNCAWIMLIKPQFEAGKGNVGRAGIVRDPEIRKLAIESVINGFAEVGLGCQGLAVSSITGTTGNVEFVAQFTRGPGSVGREAIARISEEQP